MQNTLHTHTIKIHRFIFSLLIFHFLTISVIYSQTPIRVPIGQQIKKVEQKYLSEIARDIKYIPLETKPECLLQQDITKIEIFNDEIFICDDSHVYTFDMNGRFINKIAKQGRGPGEYQSQGFQHFLIDSVHSNVMIFDLISKRIITYSFDGSYQYDKKIDFLPGPSEWVNNNIMAVFNMGYTYEKLPWTDLYFLNAQAKTIKKNKFNFDKDKKYGFTVFPALFYKFKGTTRYKNPNQNLIYEISDDYSLSPIYYLDYGVYESKSEIDEFQIQINKKNKVSIKANPLSAEKIGLTRIDETNAYILINYVHKNENKLGVYDKKAQKFYQVFDREYDSYGFSDDILGGIPFVPKSSDGDYLISYEHAFSLLESLKDYKKNDGLKNIISKIKENDNHVLILVKQKK